MSISSGPVHSRHIPDHILDHIASHSAEPELWRMMATSRALREAGEKELKKYLVKQKVTARRSFMVDEYNSINPQTVEEDSDRKEELITTIERFARHLAIYPPSRTHLRHLIIEIRDDNLDVGWDLIGYLGGQLEVMEIHIISQLGEKEGIDGENSVAQMLVLYTDIDRLWRSITNSWTTHWSALTHLSLQTNSGVIRHLRHLARSLPNLQRLSLGSHTMKPDRSGFMAGGPPDNIPIFSNLVRLDISADVGTATRILDAIAASRYPNLRILTLHFLDNSFAAPIAIEERLSSNPITINTRLARFRQLECLALYGKPVAAILSQWALWSFGGPNDLPKLRILAVEEVTIAQPGKEASPPIRQIPELLPSLLSVSSLLPSLKNILWVARHIHTYNDDRYTGLTLNHSGSGRLFHHYPHLTSIELIPDYPLDSFTHVGPDTRIDRGVISFTDRPSDLDGSSRV